MAAHPGAAPAASAGEPLSRERATISGMEDLRLAELLAGLSLVTDLGMGFPPDEAMRSCVVATHLARRMALPSETTACAYYAALLQHAGCTAYSHETAALWGGNDIAVNSAGSRTDFNRPGEIFGKLLPEIARGTGVGRARVAVVLVTRGQRFGVESNRAGCEVAAAVAERIGLPSGVGESLHHIFEWWNGKGAPGRLKGEAIALPARVVQVASAGVLFHSLGGTDLALAAVKQRAGSSLDPSVAEAFLRHGPELLAETASGDPLQDVLGAESEPRRVVSEPGIDDVARAFGDMVDLKSPFLHGHASGVAELAERAAKELRLDDVAAVRRAALLHDVGRAAVPSGVWDKPGPLSSSEWEQVRLHPYHSERILSRTGALAQLAQLAGFHHEGLDGSGYHRQATAPSIPVEARVIAAADAYQAMTQDRPHRPALAPNVAAAEIVGGTSEALDPEVVRTVLEAAGHERVQVPNELPAGLSEREVEVLRLLTRGLTIREVGRRLFISPKTADRHAQNIYAKIGVSSRAAAAMFAMQHDLVRP